MGGHIPDRGNVQGGFTWPPASRVEANMDRFEAVIPKPRTPMLKSGARDAVDHFTHFGTALVRQIGIVLSQGRHRLISRFSISDF
jgi:hypothetical protein